MFGSPLFVGIAVYTRRNTLRLNEASGDNSGTAGQSITSKAQSLVFIGESPVAGVGVSNYQQSLTAMTARSLAEQTGCSFHWKAIGKNGITLAQTIEELLPKLTNTQCDLLVILLGVNDVTSLNSLTRWHQGITELIKQIRAFSQAKILVYGVPPLHQFPALVKPLGLIAGFRAYLFDLVTSAHPFCGKEFSFRLFKSSLTSEQFAADGYHPSEQGCREMGELIAEQLLPLAVSKTNEKGKNIDLPNRNC